MRPKVYVETSVISYLTARPSRDVISLAHQELTRQWWIQAALVQKCGLRAADHLYA